MAKNQDGERFAPYCPPATLQLVLKTYRKRDVPDALDKPLLIQIGVPDGLLNRTWQALVFLGLIDADGTTTKEFKALRYATDDDYPNAFRAILEKAYAQIFSVLDPATATEVQLNNAFHPYSPLGQRSRMVTLFLGLCQEAAIPVSVTPRSRTTQAEAGKAKPAARRGGTPAAPLARMRVGRPPTFPTGEDAALVAWFNTRPEPGVVWPAQVREKWNKTLMAIIDGMYAELEIDAWETEPDDENAKGGGE